MTLAQLSERSGLSVPFLSQLENNRAKPSAQSLAAIADAVGVCVGDIVGVAKTEGVVDVDPAPSGLPVIDRSLGTLGGQVRVTELTRHAGGGESWQAHAHGVILYVVHGTVVVTVSNAADESSHTLAAGGRLLCGSGVVYRWHAEGEVATVIAVRVDDRAILSRD